MTDWAINELEAIDKVDDLKIALFYEDLKTTGTPVSIRKVVVDNRHYIHPYGGTASRSYQSAIKQQRGKIIVAGKTQTVVLTH